MTQEQGISAMLTWYGYWLDSHPKASVADRDEWVSRALNQPIHPGGPVLRDALAARGYRITPAEAGLGAHPEDHCGRCGGPNPSWHAASPLWNAVMRQGDREPFGGIICPNCFAVLAAEAGVTGHVCLTTHDAEVPLSTTMDQRVWDRDSCMWVEPAALFRPAADAGEAGG